MRCGFPESLAEGDTFMTAMKQFVLFTLLAAAAQAQTDPCASLNHLNLPHATLTAERVTEGSFKSSKDLPPFCRVTLVSSPEPSSRINIEVWLPETGWNHRLLGTGNGGGAGKISYGDLTSGLRRHFAVANTDLGTSPSADSTDRLPAKAVDFGHRATHEMTLAARAVITAYYKQPPERAYFYGCSTGGQQALSEAQRYPADYDGIVAGAPANNRTHLHSEFLWHYQVTHAAPDNKSFLPPDLIKLLTAEVLKACVGKDGGAPTDTFLTDPRACRFTPDQLPHCTATLTTSCFTPEQLTALKAIYAGPTNPTTGEQIYAPIPFGSEAIGGGLISQTDPKNHPLPNSYPFLWTLGADWNPLTFSFDRDEALLDKTFAADLNANNPDLTPFKKHGGKLLMYTGTADPLVPFPDAIHYYERVIHAQHNSLAATQAFFRYYLVPGMAHCGGGPGLTNASQPIAATDDDMLTALEAWVEHDTPPPAFPATGNGLSRNLCAYPELPTYTTGDPALASSFTCKAHPRDIDHPPATRYLK